MVWTYKKLREVAEDKLITGESKDVRAIVTSFTTGEVAEDVIADLLRLDWITPVVCDVRWGRWDWNGRCAYAPSEAVNACGFCPHGAR